MTGLRKMEVEPRDLCICPIELNHDYRVRVNTCEPDPIRWWAQCRWIEREGEYAVCMKSHMQTHLSVRCSEWKTKRDRAEWSCPR